ncbi:MAG: class I SAM-dependent methyltransferase [Elusimicrobia bacterium]|nr:class I SAM-dependent methyltransferase [Elusimicrobiota bacterium]MBP9698674.1 class I SAM-dependent methyltransferase [Elusimicrobiota bacterium]
MGIFDARLTTDLYGGCGRVVRCRQCGLAYRNPREATSTIEKAYISNEDPDALGEQECRSINAFLSLKTIREFREGGRLLEVGSSLGHFLNAARSTFDAVGIEPNRWASRWARERFRVDVREGVLSPGLFAPDSFDVVVAIDLLEHVTDPQALVTSLSHLLVPGGVLYIVTPNIESLSCRLLGRWWWGFRPSHLTYFSPKTMARMLSNAGLYVRQCRSYGRVFSYGYWLSRLKNYPSLAVWPISFVLSLMGWAGKVLYLDTRDSMEIIAFKRAHS